MNTEHSIEAIKPCHNHCIMKGTEKDDQPTLMGALHGWFCDKEFYAITSALNQAAEVVEHVVSLRDTSGGTEDNVQSSRGAPLPFNVQAFNDANETYQRLVYWTNLWADRLRRQAPGAAKRAWKDAKGNVIGLPYDVAPARARYAVSTMAIWLSAHLEDIMWQTPDDVDFFHSDMKDIFRIAARWPSKMKARFAKIPCHICQARIAVYPPNEQGDEMHIVCQNGHIYSEDKFEHEIRVFAQLKEEEARAAKVKAGIVKRYKVA